MKKRRSMMRRVKKRNNHLKVLLNLLLFKMTQKKSKNQR
jgi:hypothetical protein